MASDHNPLVIGAAAVAVVAAGGAIACLALRGSGRPKGVRVCALTEIPPGTMKEVKIGDRTVLLAHTVTGKVLATGAKCTHYNASLVKGVLDGERIVCPWHGACFNACTGDIEDGPVLEGLPSFQVEVSDAGDVFVEVPEHVPRSVAPKMANKSHGDTRNFVIIGAGAAASTAVETLRSNGYTGEITLINKDEALPYDRTKLSKNMAVTLEDVQLRKPEFYASLGVTMRLGVAVTTVRPATHEVVLANGDVIRYTKLLCATGGPARCFKPGEGFVVPGAELDNIFPLRDVEHSVGVEAAVQRVGKDAPIVIVGSSFIGMEAAAYLVKTKKCTNVTVIGMEKVPFERVLGPQLGAFMQKVHEEQGVRFVMNANVKEFIGTSGIVSSVALASGQVLPAALVILGAGIIPATQYLADAAGVDVLTKAPGGVRVDEYLRAGDDIYVAGDIAYFPYKYGVDNDHSFVRIEHWDVAMDQGRVAARNMLGKAIPFATIPFFWTAQYGKSVRYAGYCKRTDDVIIHGALSGLDAAFTAYFVVGENVAAVCTFNKDPQAAAAMELLRLGEMPSPKQLRTLDHLDLQNYLRDRTLAPGRAAAAGAAAAM